MPHYYLDLAKQLHLEHLNICGYLIPKSVCLARLQSLVLSNVRGCDWGKFEEMIRGCSFCLEELHLSKILFTGDIDRLLRFQFCNMKRVEIESCYNFDWEMEIDVLQSRSLCLLKISRVKVQIVGLDFGKHSLLSLVDLCPIDGDVNQTIIPYCNYSEDVATGLNRLNIIRVYGEVPSLVRRNILQGLSKGCEQLEELSIGSCVNDSTTFSFEECQYFSSLLVQVVCVGEKIRDIHFWGIRCAMNCLVAIVVNMFDRKFPIGIQVWIYVYNFSRF